MADRPTIAYLTSAYARAADTFIRGEVRRLRERGLVVHTFSIRRSGEHEAVSDEIRREQASTEYLVERGFVCLSLAGLTELLRSPLKWVSAFRLAQKVSPPGIKARCWHLAYLFEACLLARRLRARGVEHLHNHIGENSATVAMLASLLSGIPFSMTIHGPGEFDRPERLALDEKIARAKFTAAITHFARSQLFRWVPHEHWRKIHVVRCAVEESFLSIDLTDPPDQSTLLTVGRIAEQKGQLLLVETVGLLRSKGVELVLTIIGEGPMRSILERRIAELGLQDCVRIAGWKNASEIRQSILKSRALVLPSFAEGLPIVLMESLALGRPVITTSIAGIPELVRGGDCGWLVPAGSMDALADAIQETLRASTADLGRMGRIGAARVAELHDPNRQAERLEELMTGE